MLIGFGVLGFRVLSKNSCEGSYKDSSKGFGFGLKGVRLQGLRMFSAQGILGLLSGFL